MRDSGSRIKQTNVGLGQVFKESENENRRRRKRNANIKKKY